MNNHTILTKTTRCLALLAVMLIQVLTGTTDAWAQYSDGDTFTAQTVEGVDMDFKVLSVAEMTCQVGDGTHCSIADGITAVTVPATVNGFTVTTIGRNGLKGGAFGALTSAILPSTISTIGESAFEGASGLLSIDLPNAVTSIGNNAFLGCSALASITMAPTVSTIGEDAFHNCPALTEITLPTSITTISASAFSSSGLTSITIPEGVTSIGNSAFQNCSSLATVNFPSTLLSIGDNAFSACDALTAINLPSSLQTIGEGTFTNCESVTSVTIPASVTSIGNNGFGINALRWVTVESATPFTITSNSFNGATMGDGVLYVQQDAIDTYHNTEYWSQFNRIYAIGKHPYAVLEGNTLTFYCDDQREARTNPMELNFTSANNSPIYPHKDEITSVVFDDSFADFTELTSTGSWFYDCGNLASITGLEKVNTSKVTTMDYMFDGCRSLTSLDVSNFDWSSVQTMSCMFRRCSGLTNINLDNFNASSATNFVSVFDGCTSLEAINISDANTSSAINMSSMFSGCQALTELNLGSFNTANVTNMVGMFSSCASLTTIYVGSGWTTGAVSDGASMFYNNYRLEGGAGTTFDPTHTDQTYAHIDGGSSNPGYFTDIADFGKVNEAYAVLADNDDDITTDEGTAKGKTLTFYYDKKKEDRAGMYVGPFGNYFTNRGWDDSRTSITRVVFDESFANDTTITSTAQWFRDIGHITTIEGLQYLHTQNVTDMNSMFYGCSGFTSLDLSSFNTQNVTNMAAMFYGCSGLTSLNINGFKTQNVTDMSNMFASCSNLASIDVTGFDTQNVRSMNRMFQYCSSLTTIDVSGFNTQNVTDLGWMFDNCSSLTSLNLTNFNTQSVVSMRSMFGQCSNLTSLDLSSFNTQNVTNMSYMFYICSALTTIYVGNNWNTNSVTESDNMFYICDNLVGGYGTAWDIDHRDVTYAHIDGGPDNPGYLTDIADLGKVNEAYAVLAGNDDDITTNEGTAKGKTMTFYYDKKKESRSGLNVTPVTSADFRSWHSESSTITTVVFDSSFANDTTLTSTAWWFFGMGNLKTITGIENLKTDSVTSMIGMFQYCESLTSLDLSGFNTSKVESMEHMFYGCKNLASIDMSNFNTANVTSMASMFYRCQNLLSIDLSGFNTSNVLNMSAMFENCSAVTSLDMSGFNTANVTSTEAMFSGCTGLTVLDISSFNTAQVTEMTRMFGYCTNLKTIYVGSDWSATNGNGMFVDCTNLVGGAGTVYNPAYIDWTYAHIDGGPDNPGYLTDIADLGKVNEAYAVLSEENTKLTFYYDKQKESRNGMDVGPFGNTEYRGWHVVAETVKSVVFDDSFANDTTTTSTAYWFYGMTNLTSIEGLSYLNTSKVTDMQGMFSICSSLTSIDVTGFNTANVTNMNGLFAYCSNLTSLDLTGFNTANVTDMGYMFPFCSGLTSLDLSSFNTNNVTNMWDMFGGCSGLTSLNVTGFNTEKVTNMESMFFSCSNLTNLDVSNFNTANVTDMAHMFAGCYGLTTLDLSSFNTGSVTDMSQMFFNCYALTTIYASSNWTNEAVTDGTYMFSGCDNLVGGQGTVYDANHVNHTYAHIDGGPSNPGYLTKSLSMGDANGDGDINIADAVATVTNILGEPTEGNFYRYAADMNSDSVIDIFDVTLIVNAVLDATKPAPAMTRGYIDHVPAEAIRLTADANQIYMDVDQAQQYTAFQFDMSLPEGMSLVGVKLASDRTDHQVSFVQRGDNKYRVVGLSMSNETLCSADGHLIQLQVSDATSEGRVKVGNVLFVTPAGKTVTGIDELLNTTMATDGNIYNLKGEKLDKSMQQLGKGIYIMNHKKVIIK